MEVPTYTTEYVESDEFAPFPPNPIITQEFTNGRMQGKDSIKYYYFPIDYPNVGLPMVILNKTKMSGQKTNGDTYLIANIQKNITNKESTAFTKDYKTWDYPTLTNFHWGSKTSNPDTPEILEACFDGMVEHCGDNDNGCALLIGVVAADD